MPRSVVRVVKFARYSDDSRKTCDGDQGEQRSPHKPSLVVERDTSKQAMSKSPLYIIDTSATADRSYIDNITVQTAPRPHVSFLPRMRARLRGAYRCLALGDSVGGICGVRREMYRVYETA